MMMPKGGFKEGDPGAPEFLKHMNAYIKHPEKYPFTECKTKRFVRLVVQLEFRANYDFPIKGRKVTKQEEARFRREVIDQQLKERDTLSLDEFLTKHNLDYPALLSYCPDIRERREDTAKCVKCGEVQVIERDNLSEDRDYWICEKCGQTHSVLRAGMEK